MENTKFNFSSIKKEKMSVNNGFDRESNPYREDHPDTPKYMKFGSDNMYPEYLISLYNQSSTHASCVNAIVQAITGEGLITDDEDILKVANREGESWNDIFGKVALDYKLFGGYALEIIYSRDRSKIAEVYHVDFSHVRAMEKNDRNKIPGFYISSEWKPIWNYNIEQDDKKLQD